MEVEKNAMSHPNLRDLTPPAARPLPWSPGSSPLPADAVEAVLTFTLPGSEKPIIEMVPPGGGEPRRNATYVNHRVRIHDARQLIPGAVLDREGFELIGHRSAIDDFYDDAEVKARYYPETEDLIRKLTGARDVVAFDHNTRIDAGEESDAGKSRPPVRRVHNDYTVKSGPQRVRDLFPAEEAAAKLRRRFAIVNLWRPIAEPVLSAPLAVADAQSLSPGDLIAADLVYPDRTGEIYEVGHGAAQRWFYYPEMERTEALLIKGYDSLTDGRARFTPHTAFDSLTPFLGAPPRESIEVRTLVFFD